MEAVQLVEAPPIVEVVLVEEASEPLVRWLVAQVGEVVQLRLDGSLQKEPADVVSVHVPATWVIRIIHIHIHIHIHSGPV